MSTERFGEKPEAAIEDRDNFSLSEFAASINARVVLPSPPRHERSAFSKTDVRKIWALYGPERAF